MHLKVTPLQGSATPAFVRVAGGQLAVDCSDQALGDELAETLATRYFVQGQGFPVFAKDGSGALLRTGGRLSLAGFVDLAAPERELLSAIGENFRIGEQYQAEIEE